MERGGGAFGAAFAERFELPVVTSYRRGSLFDARHPCYAGDLGIGPNPRLVARIKESDLPIVLGGRLGEIPSQGFTLFDIPRPRADARPHPFLGGGAGAPVSGPPAIHATPIGFAAALDALKPRGPNVWSAQTGEANKEFIAWTQAPTPQPGPVNLGAIMVWLREHAPPDAILCNGAGNYAAWIHRFYRFRQLGSHIAPTSASMGYGVPAAVAMQRLHPDRLVLSINGDGDFLMNGQEFATAVQYGLPIIVIVCDNASYGTIRMHQEREYPGRVFATDLRNPDFAAYARAFGGFGVRRREDRGFSGGVRGGAGGARAGDHPRQAVDRRDHPVRDADADQGAGAGQDLRRRAERRNARRSARRRW